MKIDICALFPGILNGYLSNGVIQHAIAEQLLTIETHCFADYDPEGIGPVSHSFGGKRLRAEPVVDCVTQVQQRNAEPGHVILLTPTGRPFTQDVAVELAGHRSLTLLCGRFGGFEQTVQTQLQADEVSVGDFILNGGEVAAMVILDAVIRLVPGVLGPGRSRFSSRGILAAG